MTNLIGPVSFATWAINEKTKDIKKYGKPIRASHLSIGDYLTASKGVVKGITSLPSGKMRITIEYPNKKIVTSIWNKSTTVKIAS